MTEKEAGPVNALLEFLERETARASQLVVDAVTPAMLILSPTQASRYRDDPEYKARLDALALCHDPEGAAAVLNAAEWAARQDGNSESPP